MSDNFEKAMQAIALESTKNGGPTIQDVLTALVAKNEDDDERTEALAVEAKEAKRLAEKLAEEARLAAAVVVTKTETFHLDVTTKLDEHISTERHTLKIIDSKLTAMEKKSTDIAGSFESAMATPLFKKLIDDRDRVIDDKIAEHHDIVASVFSPPDSTSGPLQDLVTSWRFFRWFGMILIVVILGWGVTYWADSCASNIAEQRVLHYEQTHSPVPTTIP
jgi:Fe2+ transport system protein B